jgi:hypothetical protein
MTYLRLIIAVPNLRRFQMSDFQHYLSFITATKTSLHTQMRELERLRDQVNNAQFFTPPAEPQRQKAAKRA